MEKEYVIGVDLGGTTVKIGLFRTNGKLLHKYEILTRTEKGGGFILKDIGDSIEATLMDMQIPKEAVSGIGMGVPGAVKRDNYVAPCVNLEGWGGFNVADTFSVRMGIPVKVGNDANVAALGEMWQGGGMGCRNLLFVTLGTGVGGGVVIDGNLVTGTHGAAGEIGHIKVKPDETECCGCGKRGCLEQYASAPGIVNSAVKMLALGGKTSLRHCDELTCEAVFNHAKTGDEAAKQLLEDWGRVFGMALATVSCVYDPEIIVIGGGVSKAGKVVTDLAEKYFKEFAFPAAERTAFALASLGNDAGIYGAAKLAMG